MGFLTGVFGRYWAFDALLPWWLSYRGGMGRRNFLLGSLPVFALGGVLSNAALHPLVSAPLALPLIWVMLGLALKRLRDAGFPPFLALLGCIPLLGWIALAILLALPGKGSAKAPVWKVFVTGLSAFLVLSVLGSAVIPTDNLVGQGSTGASDSQVVDDAELQLADPPTPDTPEGGVSEGSPDVTGSIEEDAAEEAVEPEEEAPAETPEPEPAPEVAPPPVEGTGFEARIAQLRVEPEFPSGYDRDLFGGWRDADGDGCNSRWEVLIAESLTPVSVGAGCSVSGGQWYSAFDGVTTTDPSSFDVDHFVPLKEAWDSGAHAWSTEQRRRFANDLDYPGSLMAVTASSNRSKGAGDPAEWLPMASYRCEYVRNWVEVKLRWNLSVDSREVTAIRSLGC